MSLEQAAYLSQIVAAFGVLASLIFVGLQILQNTRATRAQTQQHIASSWFVMGQMIADHPAAFAAGLKSEDAAFSDLSEEDRLTNPLAELANAFSLLASEMYQLA